MSTLALAICRVLSLPISGGVEGKKDLSHYANKFIYLTSFLLSQKELLESVQRATKTSAKDWTIEHGSVEAYLARGGEKMSKGDFTGLFDMLFGTMYSKGHGGDFQSTRGVENGMLGLPEERLDDVMAKVVASLPAKDSAKVEL